MTKGELTVSKIYNYTELKNEDIMNVVAKVESKSEHPIAKAIRKYVVNLENDIHVEDFKAIPGYGVSAVVENEKFLIGNKKLMAENGIEIENSNNEEDLICIGNSILYVAKNNKIIALIGVKDVVKENAKKVVAKLKEQHINVVMLTGDNEKTAEYIASELGINNVIANVKPREKAETINKLKKYGMVAMCGDGINDSVSLVTADIGISISTGTDIAMDSSSVVIMNDNLDKINELISISKKTITNIKQNLFWAFFYNICMIPIAMGVFSKIGVKLNPMLAALAMTISSLTVVLNALRLRR